MSSAIITETPEKNKLQEARDKLVRSMAKTCSNRISVGLANNPKKKRRMTTLQDQDDSDSEGVYSLKDSSSEFNISSSSEDEQGPINQGEISEEHFVLVRCATKSSLTHYVGRIMSNDYQRR